MSPRPGRVLSSIRFRLTAWYTALLGLTLIVLAIAVLSLAQTRLQHDMDARLYNTADDIANRIVALLNERRESGGPIPFAAVTPSLDSFTSRGLLVQIVDAGGGVVQRSEAAPPDAMSPPDANPNPRASYSTGQFDDWRVRVVDYPLILVAPNETPRSIGSVLVGERTDTFEETLRSLQLVLLWPSLVGLVLGASGAWLLAKRALRPVDRITETAAAIAGSDGMGASLATRLPVSQVDDELSRLSSTFNAMLDRIESSFAAQRRFVADASHELRTPLTGIRGNIDVLARQIASTPADVPHREDMLAATSDIQQESARMGRLLGELLALARSDNTLLDSATPILASRPMAPVRLDAVVRAATRGASGLLNGQSIAVDVPPITVAGDADRLVQLVLILLDNAIRHTPPGKQIRVWANRESDVMVAVHVDDEGSGIDPGHLDRVFDRFYRVDDARDRATGGAGLGLSIARDIAHGLGGDISVRSTPGQGSRFTIRLPAGQDNLSTDAEASEDTPRHRSPVPASGLR